MNIIEEEVPSNKNARISGALYLAMAPFAGFSLFVNFSNFIHGDPLQTVTNIQSVETLYRLGVISWLIQQTIFILLAVSLFNLFRRVNKISASLMAVFVFIGIAVAFSNEIFQFAVLRLVSEGDYLQVFDRVQLNSLVVLFSHLHNHGIQIAHIFWGLWLFPLAHLIYSSGYFPKIIAVLIAVAGIGYILDFVVNTFLPDSGITVTQFTFVGEVVFPLWLLFKGVTTKPQKT